MAVPDRRAGAALLLGLCLVAGLFLFGKQLVTGALQVKALERTVSVKGLSEREVPADIAIWPVKFSVTDNTLATLYQTLASNNTLVRTFLTDQGFTADEISVSVPEIVDRQAQGYSADQIRFRYTGSSTITIYTSRVDAVRTARDRLLELGQKGLTLSSQEYEAATEFLFTGLNTLKPAMIEEATRNAREVAEKFAQDSQSRLGKIRQASQGQFTISDRDSNTPYIKKVRVVSTVEYYLVD